MPPRGGVYSVSQAATISAPNSVPCETFFDLRGARVFACGGREVMTSENIEEVYGMHVHIIDYMGIPLVVPFPEIQL